jgi:polysaccharide biosynthesis/export protein VpsN
VSRPTRRCWMDEALKLNWNTLRIAVMRTATLILLGALTGGTAAAGTRPNGKRTPERPPAISRPLVGKVSINDLLRIHVDGEPALSGRYRVDRTGGIDYPFVGRLTVSGLKPAAVAKLIADRLKQGHLNDPKVSVEIAVDKQGAK